MFLCLDKRLGITDSGLRTRDYGLVHVTGTGLLQPTQILLSLGGWLAIQIHYHRLFAANAIFCVGRRGEWNNCPVTCLRCLTLDHPITQPIRYLSPDNPSLNQSRLRHCVAVRPWWLQTVDCTLHSINWHSTETLHCCQSLIQRVDCAQHWTNLPNKAGFVGKNLLHL